MGGVDLAPVGLIHAGGELGGGVFEEVARIGGSSTEEDSVGGEAGMFSNDVVKSGAGSGSVE